MTQQVVAEISVVPLGTAGASLSQYVAACVEALKKAPDVSYQLTAMGTIIQGSLKRVLEVAEEMHQVPFAKGAQRVITTIKIDDRRDKPLTIEGKVKSVAERMGDG